MFLIISVYTPVLSLLVLQVRNKKKKGNLFSAAMLLIVEVSYQDILRILNILLFHILFLDFWHIKCILRGYGVIHGLS